MAQKYRMITRSDLDGIAAAALLRDIGLVDEIMFVHPKDMQDGKIEVTENDVIVNLPYHPKAHMVFDHHASEIERNTNHGPNMINDPTAPSAAAVVYKHFGGAAKFPNITKELMDATNQIDAAQLSREEVLNPTGWIMLGFLTDNRTGLGRFRHFRISNYQLMMELVDMLRKNATIEQIMANPDVAERVKLYHEHAKPAAEQIARCSTLHGKLLVVDLRKEEQIYAINRFAIYTLHPDINISMHIIPGKLGQNTVFAIGKSVTNRTAKVDVGSLMLSYGGGGHKAVGTCQIDNDKAEQVKAELIDKIVKAG